MQIRVKTPTDGGEAEFLTKFYCNYKKYCLNLRKRTLTSALMNIRRYITALLLLFGCIISMSAAAVPDVRSVVRQDGAVVESNDYYPYGTPFTTAEAVQPYKYGAKELDRMHGLDLYDSEAIQV